MSSAHEVLREEQRLRVARGFLLARPRIALVGALINGAALALSPAPRAQKLLVATTFAATVAAFFGEARHLSRNPLRLAHLRASLALTLLALSLGVHLTGALASPLTPLLFAPVVVAFAAFGSSRATREIAGLATCSLLGLALLSPPFPAPPAPYSTVMALASALVALALLGLGVVGLVEAHERVGATLDRMRADLLAENARRARAVERLGAEVAHEVKNPLTAVRGLVQLVARGASDKDRERLEVALTEVDRALALLGDYLGFARPLSELRLGTSDLRAIADDVATLVEARAAEREVRVEVLGPPLPRAVDAARLKDALLNLALNALDAMPSGGALRLLVEGGEDRATIVVSDTGAGMAPEQLARLGAPFESGREGGTGLGVSIARSVIAQHGGTLRFESTPGAGTRAFVELGP